MPSAASSAISVSGGVRRSVCSPALPITSPCASAASTTGAAGRSSSTASRSPSPRTSPNAASPSRELRGHVADVGEQLVVDRVDDGARRGARDRVAAERRGVVAGLEARRCVVGDEQRADRQAVREALRERDRVGPHAELCQAKNAPLRPTPVCTSSKISSAPCSSASARASASDLGRERVDAALALHRLEQDRRGVGPDVLGERLGRREARAGDERLERRALRGLPGDRERAERAPVERAVERDDLAAAGRLARPLERGLDRLGARVAEERAARRRSGRRASRASSCIGSVQ